MSNNIDAVVIVSGGLDSVTLLHHVVKTLKKSVAVITFNYGQRHALLEIPCAEYQVEELGLDRAFSVVDFEDIARNIFQNSALMTRDIDVPEIDDVMGDPQPITYVPNRNMIFLSIAFAYAESVGASEVYYGAQKHDIYGYWDTTPDFLSAMNNVTELNRKNKIQIAAPFVDMSKADILQIGADLDVDYSKTWSCYEGRLDGLACGTCSTCAERLKAFSDAGIIDPVPYVSVDD